MSQGHWRYKMLEELGRGGTSAVHRALDLATGSEVALKSARGEHAVSLKAEYARLHRLRHPGLVRALDLHLAGGSALLSLELLGEGPAEGGARPGIGRVLETWANLASALGHLHANGLVHGDVKPGNIRYSGEAAKLIDLGLAGSPRPKGSGFFSGTPAYAAPESLEHGELSPVGDIYSLGLVVWELAGAVLPPADLRLDPGEGWLKAMPSGLTPEAAELLRSMLRLRPFERVRDGIQLSWAMAEAGLTKNGPAASELPFCGRAGELRRALAGCKMAGADVEIVARPGTGGTRFLEELKFLLQIAGAEALMVDGRGGPGGEPAPPGCLVLADRTPVPPGRGNRVVLKDGHGPGRADGIFLGDMAGCDYRTMLGRMLRGADPSDLDRLASWLWAQAGGHVKTAAALMGELSAGRLIGRDGLHWNTAWPGVLALETEMAVEGIWSGRWEALDEPRRSRLREIAFSGSGRADGGTDPALNEWVRPGDGGCRFVGEAARAFVLGRCSDRECRAEAGRGGLGVPSPAVLRACRKAGDDRAWLDNCRALQQQALAEGSHEEALHYSVLLADSGLLKGDEFRSVFIQAAMLCRRLARYSRGLELAERHSASLAENWGMSKTAIVLQIAAGRCGEAREQARKWIGRLPPGARETIEAGLYLGLSEAMDGDRTIAMDALLKGERQATALGDRELMFMAKERLASVAHRYGDWEAVIRHARAGLELAGPKAQAEETEFLTLMLGNGLAQTGKPAEAIALLEGYIAESGGRISLPELGNMRACLGLSYLRLERWGEALESLGRAEHLLRRTGDLRHLAFITASMAMAHGAAGRHGLERQKHLEAFALSRRAGDRNAAAMCLGNAGFKQAVLGDRDGAGRTLEQALEMASGEDCGRARVQIHKNLGILAHEQGRHQDALASFERSRAEAGSAGPAPHFEAVLFGALAALASGDRERARDWSDQAAGLSGNRRQNIWSDFAKELLMAQEGRGDAGRIPETIEAMREQGRPRDAAMMALAAAEASAGGASAEPWRLLGHLVAAEAEFERLGDRGHRARARDAIVETAKALAAGGPAGGQAMLEAFYQLAFLLGSGAGPDRVGREAVEQAVRLSDAERGGLFLVDTAGRPTLLSGVNLDPETERDAADFSLRAIGQAAGGGTEVFSDDAQAQEEFRSRQSVQRNAIRSLACMPISFREGGAGALYLDSRLKPGVFSAGRLRFLRALADMAGAVVEASRMMEELRAGQPREQALERIIGDSEPMRELKERIRRAAPSGVNVLIEGETGTGKELAARAIHELSPRGVKAFIALDCGSLPETLLESELFGCAKGAFTGAHADKPGLFEAADGGTLFLDEITSASQAVQARLLRVVEEGEIRRVGETRARKVDVRLICAANKNMEFEVSEGRFKQDLYFRLNEFRIAIPPLRERDGDVLALAEHFRRRHQKTHGRRGLSFTAGAASAMASYPWPGNIRELENAVQKAVIMEAGEVITEAGLELPEDVWKPATQEDRRKKGVTKGMLLKALKKTGRDTAKAAKILGITQRQVQRLVKRFRMTT